MLVSLDIHVALEAGNLLGPEQGAITFTVQLASTGYIKVILITKRGL